MGIRRCYVQARHKSQEHTIFGASLKLFYINYGVFYGSQKAKQTYVEFVNSETKKYYEYLFNDGQGSQFLGTGGYVYNDEISDGIKVSSSKATIGTSNLAIDNETFSTGLLYQYYHGLWYWDDLYP